MLDSCRAMENEGFEVTYLPVKPNGIIDMDELERAMRPTTSLVTIMTVNNEIGVKQPVQDIGNTTVVCDSSFIISLSHRR